jgi:ubiquinone/menaquinone biosynthesis C-methylase UbiE
MNEFDKGRSVQYRAGDERAASHGSRQHYCEILRELSAGFGHKISVLDVGCGTGRYFHCLRKVRRLVGTDISPHMLEQARSPVNSNELDIEKVDLLCADAGSLEFADESFDFIYSIGVVGEYTPINSVLLDNLYRLLAPKGKLFFTAVDVHSRLPMPEGTEPSLTRRVLRKVFPVLPSFARKALNRALSSFYVTERELTRLQRGSQFATFSISRYEHPSGWRGTHFDCLAEKGDR